MKKTEKPIELESRLFLFAILSNIVLTEQGSSVEEVSQEQVNIEESNEPISAEIIHYAPTPKMIPFFIGPPIIPYSEDEDEFPQSLPNESLVVLSESTSEIEPEMTPEPQEGNLFRDWREGRESSNCGGNNVADLLITGRVSRCRKS